MEILLGIAIGIVIPFVLKFVDALHLMVIRKAQRQKNVLEVDVDTSKATREISAITERVNRLLEKMQQVNDLASKK
jgi:hypothetical protein